MAAIDTAGRIRAAALAAIERECLGEDFGFDAALALVPGPSGPQVMYTLVVTMRSPLLSQGPLMNVTQIASASPSAEQVEQAVSGALRGLRDLSGKLLAGANGAAGLPAAG